ncbi:unnamed protein product, partial [Rotaria sp. Silwood2]
MGLGPNSPHDSICHRMLEKPYDQCFNDYSHAGPKLKLSQASQDIIFK